jgi:hypothetical protein
MGGESPHPFRARQPGSEGRSRGPSGQPLTGCEDGANRNHAAGSAERAQPRGRCLVVGLGRRVVVAGAASLLLHGESKSEAGRDGDRKSLQPSLSTDSAVQDRHRTLGSGQRGARDAGDRGPPAGLAG